MSDPPRKGPLSADHRVPKPRPSRGTVARLVRTVAQPPAAELREGAQIVGVPEANASSVAGIVSALPDPATLPGGALVIVRGAIVRAPSLARSVLAVFGRTKTVSRALRCSALVARGYVRVGAAEDADRTDLAWGYAPDAPQP